MRASNFFISQLSEYLNELYCAETYDSNLEMSIWKDNPFIYDLSVTRCTSSAMLIAYKFEGTIVGYSIDNTEKNKNIIGFSSLGHDFCIIQNRYVVDYWAKYVNNWKCKAIIDLHNPYDYGYFLKHYYMFDRWEILPMWERLKGLY